MEYYGLSLKEVGEILIEILSKEIDNENIFVYNETDKGKIYFDFIWNDNMKAEDIILIEDQDSKGVTIGEYLSNNWCIIVDF